MNTYDPRVVETAALAFFVFLAFATESCALPVQRTGDITPQLSQLSKTAGKLEEAGNTITEPRTRALIGEAHEAVNECARTLYERDRALSACRAELKEYVEKYSFWERTKSRLSVFLSGAAAGFVLAVLLLLAVRFLWAGVKTSLRGAL